MMTLAILGILAVIGYSHYGEAKAEADKDVAMRDLTRIKLAIDNYVVTNEELPESLDDVGLGDLVDPWGNPYVFVNFTEVHGDGFKRKDQNLVPINTAYDLYSKGPDGQSAPALTAAISQDDVVVANDGSYIGPASEY